MRYILGFLASGLLSTYVFLLPYLANIFNSNNNKLLCTSEVLCLDGTSYFNITGTLVGCGCGQGIFGQSVCATTSFGYTISGFISTAPATGAMASLSALPIAYIWLYGTGSRKLYKIKNKIIPKYLLYACKVTLYIFQISYSLFLFSTVCVFPRLHDVNVVIFTLSAIIHFGIISYIYKNYYNDIFGSKIIYYLATLASGSFILFILVGYIYYNFNTIINNYKLLLFIKYLPWLFECLGLTFGFFIAPVMLFYDKKNY